MRYLRSSYPGYDLKPEEEVAPEERKKAMEQRKKAMKSWSKSFKTMKKERNAIDSFTRIIKPSWCHEITAKHREEFIQERIPEVGSALTIDVELRVSDCV
jgi:hypothetical protein